DDAVLILLLNLYHFQIRLFHKLNLSGRSDQIIDAYRDSGFRGVEESERLQFVEHAHGSIQSEPQMAEVHKRLQALLFEKPVDVRQIIGKVIVEDHAAHRRVDDAIDFLRLSANYVLRIARMFEVDELAPVTQPYGSLRYYKPRIERKQHLID